MGNRKAAFKIGFLACNDLLVLPLLLPLFITQYRYASINETLSKSQSWSYKEVQLIFEQSFLLLLDLLLLLPILPLLFITRIRWPKVAEVLETKDLWR